MFGRDAFRRDAPGKDALGRVVFGRDGLGRDALRRDALRRDVFGKRTLRRDVFGKHTLRGDVFGKDALRRDVFRSDAFANWFTPGLAADAVPGDRRVSPGDTGSISITAARSNHSPGHPLPQPSRSPGLCLHRELGAAGSWAWSTLFKTISNNSGQLGLL